MLGHGEIVLPDRSIGVLRVFYSKAFPADHAFGGVRFAGGIVLYPYAFFQLDIGNFDSDALPFIPGISKRKNFRI